MFMLGFELRVSTVGSPVPERVNILFYLCIILTKLYKIVKFGLVSLKKYRLYFKQKLIKFLTKESMGAYIYLPQKWS